MPFGKVFFPKKPLNVFCRWRPFDTLCMVFFKRWDFLWELHFLSEKPHLKAILPFENTFFRKDLWKWESGREDSLKNLFFPERFLKKFHPNVILFVHFFFTSKYLSRISPFPFSKNVPPLFSPLCHNSQWTVNIDLTSDRITPVKHSMMASDSTCIGGCDNRTTFLL